MAIPDILIFVIILVTAIIKFNEQWGRL